MINVMYVAENDDYEDADYYTTVPACYEDCQAYVDEGSEDENYCHVYCRQDNIQCPLAFLEAVAKAAKRDVNDLFPEQVKKANGSVPSSKKQASGTNKSEQQPSHPNTCTRDHTDAPTS